MAGSAAADVAPVDHAARRAAFDEHVTEVEVAVDDGRAARAAGVAPPRRGASDDSRRRAPDAEPLERVPSSSRASRRSPGMSVRRLASSGSARRARPRAARAGSRASSSATSSRASSSSSARRRPRRPEAARRRRTATGSSSAGLPDEDRPRDRQRQQRRQLRQHRELALEPRDRDLPARKAERVALVDDPDAVVPPLGQLAQRAHLEPGTAPAASRTSRSSISISAAQTGIAGAGINAAMAVGRLRPAAHRAVPDAAVDRDHDVPDTCDVRRLGGGVGARAGRLRAGGRAGRRAGAARAAARRRRRGDTRRARRGRLLRRLRPRPRDLRPGPRTRRRRASSRTATAPSWRCCRRRSRATCPCWRSAEARRC